MYYKLYTTVDITHTKQYRNEPGKEQSRWKEQNFQCVIQTLGMRSNVEFDLPPAFLQVKGSLIGFNTDEIINVWRFDFKTERDHLYESNGDPVGFLINDFNAVPYIAGLDECMEQNYAIFVTAGPARNIIFHKK